MKWIIFLFATGVIAAVSDAKRSKRQFFSSSEEDFQPRYPAQNFQNRRQFFPGNQGFQGFPNQGFQGNQGFPNQGFQNGNQGFQGNQGFPNQGFQGGSQGFQGGNQGFQGGNQGFQGGNQGFQNGNQGNQGFPNQNNQNQQRPVNQFTTTQAPIVTQAPTTLSPAMEQCRDACVARTTGQYNPVCGSDNQNYHNQARLDCSRECGSTVTRRVAGVCPSMNLQPQ